MVKVVARCMQVCQEQHYVCHKNGIIMQHMQNDIILLVGGNMGGKLGLLTLTSGVFHVVAQNVDLMAMGILELLT
jgi:hypothetical protein